jgi:hypothetical protein
MTGHYRIMISDQIKCIERELNYRHRVYPRLVAEGKFSQSFADMQISHMTAVLETLKRIGREQAELPL